MGQLNNCGKAILAFFLLLLPGTGRNLRAQQPPPPTKAGALLWSGSIRSRMEDWKWFTADTADSSYTYSGSTLRFGLSRSLPKIDWNVELQVPVLLNLPRNSVEPGVQGQLGLGATYYLANRSTSAALLFPKSAYIRWKPGGNPASSIRFGRFEFQEGAETMPSNPALATLKRERIQQRLIGTFGFTHVQRSFDGVQYTSTQRKQNITLVGAVPTRGVFQVDGWGWVKVAFAYASLTRQLQYRATGGEWRAFAIFYDDWRPLGKADNRPVVDRSFDRRNVRIATYGAHYIQTTLTSAGSFDVLGEFALQHGAWGALAHRAAMASLEGGFQPAPLARWTAWVRAGYFVGSGDGDPRDGKHGTFFQLLPTPRQYAQFPFYNLMNNIDRFATVSLRPHRRIGVRGEAHSLRLANRNDLWYAGGGAYQPQTFGYQFRPSGGAASLANLFSLSADATLSPRFSLSPYYGYATGKAVIQAVYPKGRIGHLGFLEFNYRF